MNLSRVASRAAALTFVAAGAALLPTPAQALSCVMPADVVEKAQTVFAGRIVDSEGGRLMVEVDEVWKGDPVEARQWLAVDLAGWTEWGGVPDDLHPKRSYVFAPQDGAVNPCTFWRAGVDHAPDAPDVTAEPVPDGSLGHAGEAPSDAHAASPRASTTSLVGAAAAGLGLGGIATALLVLRSRRAGINT